MLSLGDAVSRLIEVGRLGGPAAPGWSVADVEVCSQDRAALLRMAAGLSREQLEGLIRGRVLRSIGGSVSPVIPLFKLFATTYPQDEPALTQWIVANRINEYEPFGTIVGNNASSLSENIGQRLARDARTADNVAREAERQRQAAQLRTLRDAESATT